MDASNTFKQDSATQEQSQKRATGAPFANRNARKHGVYVLKAALKEADLRDIDRRTSLGAELARRREQILADCGGRDHVSELKADLIEKYLRTVVLIESVDAYLFTQKSLVRKRNRSLYPVVQQRTQLVDSAMRLAQAIGLERVPPPKPTLADLLKQRATEHRPSTPPAPSPSPAPTIRSEPTSRDPQQQKPDVQDDEEG